MSSKQPQHITRANYEEAFLLYVDGELSPEAMDAVDAFAALHPDLREELDLLLETRLDTPEVCFGDTSVLMADRMRLAADEDDLLCHLDGELEPAAAAAMNQRLRSEPLLRSEWSALQATKLDPADTIECPDKASLYRRERERRPLIWWRVAAAVILLAGSAAVWSLNDGPQTGNDGIASRTVKTTVPAKATEDNSGSKTQQGASPAATPSNDILPDPQNEGDALAANTAGARNTLRTDGKKHTERITSPATTPEQAPLIAHAPDPRDRVEPDAAASDALASVDVLRTQRIEAGNEPETPSQNIGNTLVTKAPTLTYTSMNTATNPAPVAAVVRNDKPQGSFRGLIRKAARFVEKRTGIKATNEDDQLVVGAVAINLK